MRVIFIGLVLLFSESIRAQTVESFGIFGGMNFPFTIDQGFKKDPRYFGRFTVRGTPIGLTYGYDKVGWGYAITPSYVKIGQKFIIKNTNGGEVGERNVEMNYFSLPMALKIHINDMAFFRLSMVAAINVNYLIQGQEFMTHDASKLNYPANVIIPTAPGYNLVYDGVFVPEENNLVYVANDKFNPLQLFAGVGLRSDFDLNDNWSLNFDGRANFGIFDPRKSDYVNSLQADGPVTDLFGERREVYLSVGVGISRIVQGKTGFKTKRTTTKRYNNSPSPRNKSKSRSRG